MPQKRSSITLSIEEHEKAQLEQLALEFDQTWGDKPNVSKLLKAIARGKLRLAVNHDWSRDRIDTCNKALNLLKDAGQINEALELAQLLLERSELSHPLRQEIERWVNQPTAPWRTDLDRCIQLHRPFKLIYQDAADRLWNFTVRHAKIERHEDRQYLDCWCDETEGNQDIELLRHNRSLRLDRIPDEAVIAPADGQWQPELSHIEIELHLKRGLALGYRTKTGADLTNEWLPERQIRRVVRRIHNTFWFFREVRRYGSECVIVSPEAVRDRFKQELLAMIEQYNAD
ncbi:WYL domain-containing protein [Thermoleptolyngbya sp. M55_K2018_002]|uniref:helix-turn-helix transcriptional regulator n=1 Tax=Thermoleptolyngbya sp. M55_K2018_002 TaxID=2747808 RepID=UPI0019F3FDD7|nr:WYL domain-containing protein [Thermoleptolyngbya sp. M55_K2018_002]HIK39595.1 WYL domain-containing protein [Thermoleptolyngbya sp. M55_K2018_002]